MNKRDLIRAAAVFLALAALSVGARTAAEPTAAGTSSSDVQCLVEPVYSFTAPPDVRLSYPNSRIQIGQFGIGELLLESGETLSVTLTPGALQTPGGHALPYDVSFEPPESFDERQNGAVYDISLTIDAAAFDAAEAGTYTAMLAFNVVSHPAGKTVWKHSTLFTAEKLSGSAGKTKSAGIWANWLFPVAAAVVLSAALAVYLGLKRAKRKKDVHAENTEPAAD